MDAGSRHGIPTDRDAKKNYVTSNAPSQAKHKDHDSNKKVPGSGHDLISALNQGVEQPAAKKSRQQTNDFFQAPNMAGSISHSNLIRKRK
jgi:hypothetical protein